MVARRKNNDYPLNEVIYPMESIKEMNSAQLEKLWSNDQYIGEEKFDGDRELSIGGRFFSRKSSPETGMPLEKTDNVPHLHSILKHYPLLLLDGEVYFSGKKANVVKSIVGCDRDKALMRQGFGYFSSSISQFPSHEPFWKLKESDDWQKVDKDTKDFLVEHGAKKIAFMVYDILRDRDGKWLLDLPWEERRKILKHELASLALENSGHQYLSYLRIGKIYEGEARKRAALEEILARDGEGMILKNVSTKYFPGRNPVGTWVMVRGK
ncbi:MAG: hypothetical protein K0Q90_1400 [Paenibacillaceae bacterium]|jgi:ATP-dependent DNA ligase|nr:hypothetical protein [Paenibacillaceae bacterium]